ncbi:MAG: SIS domain-containing protein [bacterium]|jgi:D-sedoheptulose 7-phosphate isomerase|nr:SIS domain-containing protein [bacterium]
MRERIRQAVEEGLRLRQWLLAEGGEVLLAMSARMADCLAAGGKVLFAGNGGSAADSQHLATELVVRLSAARERRALAGLALTTDSSLLTACANDYSFEQIFQRQVEALGRPGDLLVALSTSGRSANVVAAARSARALGLGVLGLLGGEGAPLAELCDLALVVPGTDAGRVQEVHITAGHILIDLVEERLTP